MPARLVAAFLTIIVCAMGSANAAFAQPGLTLAADAIFYGDNTEFRNPFREGETIFGAAARVEGRIEISDAVTLALGVFGNQRFGGETSFELVRPVLALRVQGRRSRFIMGTLVTPRAGQPAGPDRTGPHGLLPPIQRETLAFERPYEAGLQWMFNGSRLEHDIWLQWQRLNTPDHRERLDAGARMQWRMRGPFSLPLQTHIVHEGGQLHASGPVRDSVALASGIAISCRPGPGSCARPILNLTPSLELLGLWSHHVPDRQQPDRTRDGAAFFGRAALAGASWRAHLIMWRGDDFIKDEGDANYLAIRRDGRRWRGVRDYAEAGLTRTFMLAPGALIEASFRYHRIEPSHYEYSYRVLAVVHARATVK
jgi:hypothetical protein